MRRLAFPVVILLVCLGRATADDLFVSNLAGDDRFDGRSETKSVNYRGPTQTLAKALRVAQPGDRIVIANTGQPYRESITLEGPRHSGANGRPFMIEGNGATLDGTALVPPDAWRHVAGDIYRFQPQRLHYHQVFLDGRPAVRKPAGYEGPKIPALEPRQWALRVGDLFFRTEPGMMPQEYSLLHTAEKTGITLYQAHDIVITNLVVQGFQLDGVNAHDGVRGLTLAGVRSHANGRSGIAICGASQADLVGCVLSDNSQAQLHVEGLSETHVENCQLRAGPGVSFERQNGTRLYFHNQRPQ